MAYTFHFLPAAAWEAADPAEPYAPEYFATEGFIHCTDGFENLAATFDRHLAGDPQPYLAMTVDLDALDVPWRYDEPGKPFPHIYGPIRRDAIVGTAQVDRLPDGRFSGLSVSDTF
jgi:uncharacterized protein (DUF952 family)